MSTTYSLVVATGAFQHLCSDGCKHASTLKQTAVPDSIDLFAAMTPFHWHLPFTKLKLSLAKLHSLSFSSSADGPFLGMAESQHTMSESNACVKDHMQLRAYL